MQDKFDLYHFNMGNGEIVFPYAQHVHKPILVTMHGPLDEKYVKKYFSLFSNLKNVYFVSISNAQRKPMPHLNYIKTIYHGIDIKKAFQFNPVGDKYLLWTGRAVPEKGLDIVLQIIKITKKRAKIFPIIKQEYFAWLQEVIIKRRNIINQAVSIYTDFDLHRSDLNYHYQTSKLFIFPVLWEEPFGLTLIESMACGTPVVTFARGPIPEIIKDGETGFIINPSDTDKRGDWIIKKTGIEGLCEAVEKIYTMPEEQYKAMRKACREHVEKNFTVERMVDEYEKVYQNIINNSKKI
jgi:glycosyltransferase involved in cell wall biosynthesis